MAQYVTACILWKRARSLGSTQPPNLINPTFNRMVLLFAKADALRAAAGDSDSIR